MIEQNFLEMLRIHKLSKLLAYLRTTSSFFVNYGRFLQDLNFKQEHKCNVVPRNLNICMVYYYFYTI